MILFCVRAAVCCMLKYSGMHSESNCGLDCGITCLAGMLNGMTFCMIIWLYCTSVTACWTSPQTASFVS
jgi:hypothetical protein